MTIFHYPSLRRGDSATKNQTITRYKPKMCGSFSHLVAQQVLGAFVWSNCWQPHSILQNQLQIWKDQDASNVKMANRSNTLSQSHSVLYVSYDTRSLHLPLHEGSIKDLPRQVVELEINKWPAISIGRSIALPWCICTEPPGEQVLWNLRRSWDHESDL